MTSTWTARGFKDFPQGQFGNPGQNLYVSRAGVLQRIHQSDLNGNGCLDLVFCNSQNHQERPRPSSTVIPSVPPTAPSCRPEAHGAAPSPTSTTTASTT